jgi:hypothetical protein
MKRIKGEPRRRNEGERRLRAAIARIPNTAALSAFLATLPAAERAPTLRMIREHAV